MGEGDEIQIPPQLVYVGVDSQSEEGGQQLFNSLERLGGRFLSHRSLDRLEDREW